ncbi:hypothetical protein Purlil1_12445 [Purpureocillium lilacinum]|uniref:Uncharacterized protein n=1 Tax=Purpureocillium lilacinum TaxID=33203 RepID=A0ABR0BH07_PURLI|nr:hypothetical protein Purlil1_12445 [Purpureocillium lilacinum]
MCVKDDGPSWQANLARELGERAGCKDACKSNIQPSGQVEYRHEHTSARTCTDELFAMDEKRQSRASSTQGRELAGPEATRVVPAGMRDKGVSDAVWEQLERDKAGEVAKEEQFQRLQSTARDARDAARELILEEIKKEENERKRKEAIQEYLRVNGVCPVGYHWIQQCDGFPGARVKATSWQTTT